jgi:hypothetical protein
MQDKNKDLSGAWSDYFQKAVEGYGQFARQNVSMEAKDFGAYHNACKAALAHILMIQKLMQTSTAKEEEPNLLDLLEQARKATNDESDSDSFD